MDILITDFYCHPIKLVTEVDEGIHKLKEQKENDFGRTAELNYWEIEVIRFTNEEIEHDIKHVIEEIKQIGKIRQSQMR